MTCPAHHLVHVDTDGRMRLECTDACPRESWVESREDGFCRCIDQKRECEPCAEGFHGHECEMVVSDGEPVCSMVLIVGECALAGWVDATDLECVLANWEDISHGSTVAVDREWTDDGPILHVRKEMP